MIGKIIVQEDRLPTVLQIYKRLIKKKFPGIVFEVEQNILYSAAEEFHNILMEYWRSGHIVVVDELKEKMNLDTILSLLKDCPSCGNATINKETGVCSECKHDINNFEI